MLLVWIQLPDIIFLQHFGCGCGQCFSVEGRTCRKDCLTVERYKAVVLRHHALLCIRKGWWGTGGEIFWTVAFACLWIILSHFVSSPKQLAQLACPTSCRGVGVLDGVPSIWWQRTEPSVGSFRGAAYVLDVKNLRAEKTIACTLFCFSLRSETQQVRVLWGYEERVTWGERESFSWTHFMDVLGSSDENGGG